MSSASIRRLRTLIAHDVRLQFRYGIYYAYGFVVAFYVAALVFGRDIFPGWLPGLVIFTDPAVVGFFFLGALMMLEKAENVRLALGMTPVTGRAYFASKCVTLTGLSVAAVSILTIFLHQGANWPLLVLACALTSVAYLGFGVLAAAYFRTVTSYLIGSTVFIVPAILPGLMAFYDPMPGWAMLIPTASQFRLILISTGYGQATGTEVALMLAICAFTAVVSCFLAIRQLEKEFGSK